MILVTGHRGFIGQKLYARLETLGYEVIGVDLKDGQDILHTLPKNTVETVFHLAAMPSVPYSVDNPSYTLMHNVLGTSRLLEWSKNNGVKRFVFSSSAAIYGAAGEIKSPYALHKLMSEKECQLYSAIYGLDTVCLRYFNVYSEDQEYGGAYSTVIAAWLEMIRRREPLRIDGDGTQTRDFIHVEDVVEANLFCMKHQKKFDGAPLDIASGKVIKLNYIKNIIDFRYNVIWNRVADRHGDIKHVLPDIAKVSKLGWDAQISIDEGLDRCFGPPRGKK